MPKVDQTDTSKYGIEQSEGEQAGILDSLGGLLAFSGVQDTYQPSEEISVEITADAKTSYSTDNAVKVVEIYKCADSSCETPPPIDSSSEDQCSSEEWAPDYDDCIAKNADSIDFSFTVDSGEGWNWETTFSGLADESEYILVGYVWTSDQGIVTDVSKQQFTVQSSTSGGTGGTSGDVDVREVDGDIPVTVENGEISAEVELTNVGSKGMSGSNIVEMQVRPQGSGLLSTFVGPQETCDSTHPENVHKQFSLDAGDTETATLSTSTGNVESGEIYDVWIVTRSECGGGPVDPYGTGVVADTVLVEEDGTGGTTDPGTTPDQMNPVLTFIVLNLEILIILLGTVLVVGGVLYRFRK